MISNKTNIVRGKRGKMFSLIYLDDTKELIKQYPDFKPKSVIFIRASVEDNQEMLKILKLILISDINPKYYVLQFIGLDRRYNPTNASCLSSNNCKENSEMFIKTFNECEQLLTGKVWCFFGSDGSNSSIPNNIINHEKCVVWNPHFIDSTGVGSHPGIKWHQAMASLVTKKLQKQLL